MDNAKRSVGISLTCFGAGLDTPYLFGIDPNWWIIGLSGLLVALGILLLTEARRA